MPQDAYPNHADAAPTGEPETAAPGTPPLSIVHLMLWTLCSAAYLGWIRIINALQDLPARYATLHLSSNVLQATVSGAVLAGAIILLHTRIRTGSPMLRHPGHWLLIASALIRLIYLPLILALALADGVTSNDALFYIMGLIHWIPAAMYAFACHHTELRRWKFPFGAVAGLLMLQSLAHLSPWMPSLLWTIPTWGTTLLCGWIVFVSCWEFAAGQRRDWLHWTGVITQVAGAGISLLWMIGTWLIQQ